MSIFKDLYDEAIKFQCQVELPDLKENGYIMPFDIAYELVSKALFNYLSIKGCDIQNLKRVMNYESMHIHNAENLVDEKLGFIYDKKSKKFESLELEFIVDKEFEKKQTIRNLIKNLKFADINCDNGNFVFAYLELLNTMYEKMELSLEEDISEIFSNFYLNDIFDESIENLKALLSKYSEHYVNCNIFNLDGLTELESAPQFKAALLEGGFDIIVGNPPFMGERAHRHIFSKYKYHDATKKYYIGKMDLLYFFIYKGIEFLSQDGMMAYITASYFTTADYAVHLREYLRENVDFISINVGNFKTATGPTSELSMIMFVITKKNDERKNEISCELSLGSKYYILQDNLYDFDGRIAVYDRDLLTQELNDMKNKFQFSIGDFCNVNQGLVTGADKLSGSKARAYKLPINERAIFVYELEEIKRIFGDKYMNGDKPIDIFKPFIKNSEINKDGYKFSNRYLLYFEKDEILQYPEIMAYLENFKGILSKRREAKLNKKMWYELQWPREKEIFERKKIIIPSRAFKMRCTYVREPLYGSADVYFMNLDIERSVEILNKKSKRFRYLTVEQMRSVEEEILIALSKYLNSPIVSNWLMYMGKRKGQVLELYANPLKEIPIFETESFMIEIMSILEKFAKH